MCIKKLAYNLADVMNKKGLQVDCISSKMQEGPLQINATLKIELKMHLFLKVHFKKCYCEVPFIQLNSFQFE